MHRSFVVIALASLTACATSPLGRNQLILVSGDQMAQMGVASYTDMKKKVPATKDSKQAAYVNCIARNITAQVAAMPGSLNKPDSWEVTVFEDKQVNAFALPGGKIGVYTGLLKVATTQDQVAAVIGHEVSHVLANHGAERVSEQMLAQEGEKRASDAGVNAEMLGFAVDVFYLLPYSRIHESEADLLGLDLMSRAGFDPHQAVTLWENMSKAGGNKPPELLSTHPADSTRIRQIQERMRDSLPLYEKAKSAGLKPTCR
jgi:predicted Zn-dependent protease